MRRSFHVKSTYADTLDHLGRANDMGQPYGLLILGAPARMTRDFEDLLIYLRNPRVRKTAVLLLAHEKNQAIDSFIADRPDAQFLLWSNFSRIPRQRGSPAGQPALRAHAP